MEQIIKEGKVLWPNDDRVVSYPSMADLLQAIDGGTAPRHIRQGLPELDFWIGKPIGIGMPRYKMHKSELDTGHNPLSTWISSGGIDDQSETESEEVETMQSGYTAEGATLLTAMLGTKDFSYPKPLSLIQTLIQQSTAPEDIVLDFFAGSGTTAHAVLAQNGEDEGNRRFIMVSSTEATAREPETNVCRDVCQRRIEAAINGYSFATKNGLKTVSGHGGDFAYLRCRRIAPGRLVEIEHSQVWTALQMIHRETLEPYRESDWLWAGDEEEAIVYVPRFAMAHVAELRKQVKQSNEVVIYSWQPETLRQHIRAGHVLHEAIPESLARRFGMKG